METPQRQVMVVGQLEKVFSGNRNCGGGVVKAFDNMLEAITAAAEQTFDVIAVVMTSNNANLETSLKALKRVSGAAKIILLARMPQEPEAIKLCRTINNGQRIIDDYHICPIGVRQFLESVFAQQNVVSDAKILKTDSAKNDAERIKQLEKLATEDDLTGLKNRRYAWEFSKQILARAAKGHSRVTLLVFDIDDFKHYNDTYGHPAGDKILIEAASVMKRCCRKHDVVARIGGDEFAVVFWDKTSAGKVGREERRKVTADVPQEAMIVAQRFRKEMVGADVDAIGPKGKGTLTISGGLASFSRDGSTIEELFEKADAALLEAKRSGKNRIYLVGQPKGPIEEDQEQMPVA